MRRQYSYYGAGKLNKTPLNAEKKTYLQRYVLFLNPELQEDRKWKDNVVCRINEALRKATSTAVRAAVADARETLADRHDALFNQRQIAMPVANLISSVMEKSCPGRVHWPRIKLLAIESTSAQNKEDCQEQTASHLNKEDKVQADSQVKKLLALANIHTFKDGDHTQTVDDPTFGDKAQTAEGLHEVEKKKESSNEPISDNDSNATIEYDEMYERPQSPLHSNDIIENETTSDKRRTFTPQEAERMIVLCHQNIKDKNLCKKAVTKTLE